MSGSSISRGPPAQPKQISSRLLNMKFMQRAAAADKTQAKSSPKTPSQPSFKRRRTDEFQSGNNSPSTPGTPMATYTPDTASKARNNFENKTETEWVLHASTEHSRQVQDLDEEVEDEDEDEDDIWNTSEPSGRQAFGSFKKKTSTITTTAATEPESPGQSLSKSAKRNVKRKSKGSSSRGGVDLLIEDSTESDSSEGSESSGSAGAEQTRHGKKSIDFLSDEYNRELDRMDIRQSGFGKQRPGLSGKQGHGSDKTGRRGQGNTPKSRGKLGGQAFFEQRKPLRKSM